jgi:ADP-heptose:LPS heptosyltransferase
MDHYHQDGHYEQGYIDLICEMATSLSQVELNSVVSSAFFGGIVEELCDDYEDFQFDVYARLMSQVISYCRNLPAGRDLDKCLNKFHLVSAEDILARAGRIHSRIGFFDAQKKVVRKILILSRITVGADVAIVSVIVQRLARAFPEARIIILGSLKLREIFGGHPRFRIRGLKYERRGSLLERLASWQDALDVVAEESATGGSNATLLIDPESRISQLGILPLIEAENYLYFNSHSKMLSADKSCMAELANEWMDKVFGPSTLCYPRVWLAPGRLKWAVKLRESLLRSGCRRIACVNFGVGGNPRKRLSLNFEKKLICELLKEADTVVVLDKGLGIEEAANSQRIIERLISEGHPVHHAGFGCPEPVGFAHGVLAVECTIGEISALISVSDEFIGYDSACQHIAAALSVPTITIFAGSNNPRFVQRWSACGDTSCRIVHVNTLVHSRDIDPDGIVERVMEERMKVPLRTAGSEPRVLDLKTSRPTRAGSEQTVMD